MSELLPLVPLDLVLFPGAPLPLHIFEPRYKEMIGECLARHEPFGVLRVKEDAIAEIGCTAEIVEVVKRYDDGRLDILTSGERVFEIVHLDQERSFLRGEVLYLADEDPAGSAEQRQRALELHRQLLSLASEEAELPPADDPQLTYRLAAMVPLDLDFKQTLLGTRSEAERLEHFISYYELTLPKLERTVKAQRRAGGNGHV